jgi:hypothetical protein
MPERVYQHDLGERASKHVGVWDSRLMVEIPPREMGTAWAREFLRCQGAMIDVKMRHIPLFRGEEATA